MKVCMMYDLPFNYPDYSGDGGDPDDQSELLARCQKKIAEALKALRQQNKDMLRYKQRLEETIEERDELRRRVIELEEELDEYDAPFTDEEIETHVRKVLESEKDA